MKDDLITVTQGIREAARELRQASEDIFTAAEKKAETERCYRVKLAKEIMRLKREGLPATLISDVARGETANEKYERDLAEVVYRATLESLESHRSQLSALQSVLKFME